MNDHPCFRGLALVSSCAFTLGAMLSLSSILCQTFGWGLDLANERDRAIGSVLEMTAWGMIGISEAPELLIDAASDRAFAHGRRGRLMSPSVSIIQTMLFLGGVSALGLAGKRSWDYDDDDDDDDGEDGVVGEKWWYSENIFKVKDTYEATRWLLALASIFWVISGSVAVGTILCDYLSPSFGTNDSWKRRHVRLLVVANAQILLAAVVYVVGALTVEDHDYSPVQQANRGHAAVHTICRGLLVVAGGLWTWADIMLQGVHGKAAIVAASLSDSHL